MLSDCHMHTKFSADSDADMEEMICAAGKKNLRRICFTEHQDIGMESEGERFEVDMERYQETVRRLQDKYADRISIGFGVEMGLALEHTEEIRTFLQTWPFDFVIGSVHMIDGIDPYLRESFPETDEELYSRYFACVLKNVQGAEGFHTLGHLDYVVRYGYTREKDYSYQKYADVIDAILAELIRRDIALEVNAAGLKYGLPFPNPHPDILKRYRELGGEMLTVGSDAHAPQHIAYRYADLEELIRSCGFGSITEFYSGKPREIPLY